MAFPNPKPVIAWIARKPGPFMARTENGVWRAAWENFCDGAHDGGPELYFIMHVRDASFDARPTALGGC